MNSDELGLSSSNEWKAMSNEREEVTLPFKGMDRVGMG